MKRRVLFALGLSLVLALLMVSAQADTLACPMHPEGETIAEPVTEYACVNSGFHVPFSWNELRCAECGVLLGEDAEHITVGELELHDFASSGLCEQCGYNGFTGRQRTQLNGSYTNDLQELASIIGDNAIGGTLVILEDGVNLRENHNITSRIAGSAPMGGVMRINDRYMDNDGNTWYCVRYHLNDAWVSAGMVKVNPNPVPQTAAKKTHVTIKSAGNVRAGAGADFPVVGRVDVQNVYTVRNTLKAPDGSVWYQIEYGNSVAWVSGAICR